MEGHPDHARPSDLRAASPELRHVGVEPVAGGSRWSLALDPTSRAPSVARRALGPLAAQIGRRAEDARLLLSELVTNAILHGGGRDAASPVHVELTLLRGRLRVTVCDDGPGFTPEDLPGSVRGVEGGRGLEILAAVADRVGVAGPRPFRVWFELDL